MTSVNPYASRLLNYTPAVRGGSLLTPAAPQAAPSVPAVPAAVAPMAAPAAAPNPTMDALRAQVSRLSQYTQLLQLKLQLVTIQAQLNAMIDKLPATPAPRPPKPTKPSKPGKPDPKPDPKPEPKPEKPKPDPKPAPEKPEPKPAPKPEKPKPKPEKPDGSGPVLKKGLAGKPVKALQNRLKKLGFDPGPVDGLFGDKTLAAVKRFQKAKGLSVDGGVGPKTWDALGIHVKGKPKRMADMVVHTPKGPMVRRQGHLIHQSIAKGFDRMVADAKKAGVTLSINSAYRSYQEQVVLWNRYGQDPNRVARPGTSNHESGKAIDFHNTPGAWAWLKANAHRYGLRNYPPEPWHYSPTGNGVGADSAPQLDVVTFGA